MRYNIIYNLKGGSSFINKTNKYKISDDLITNILKYIDFKNCKDLIKILENTIELKEKIDYKKLNKYKQFGLELPTNYKNKLCDKLNENKKNECLKYVYNCGKYQLIKTYDISGGIKSGIRHVDINYNNTMIVAPTKEIEGAGHINIIDVNTGNILKRWKALKSSMESVNFNHDGTKLVFGGKNNISYPGKYVVGIFDFEKNKSSIWISDYHSNTINSIKFNNDGTKIVSGSSDQTIKLWNAKNLQTMLTLENQSEVTSVEFNHDGTKIVSGCFDNTISIWNIDEKSDKYGENILTLNDHSASIKSVGFNHNSTLIVSGSYDKTIRVWNVDNKSNYYGKCILILEGHTNQ